MRPIFLQCGKGIKVLKLSKSEKSGRRDDVDTEDLGQATMVKIERVLEGEKAMVVRMHDSCVLNHINVFRRPSGSDIGYDSLLEKRPIAREANEEWSGFVDVRSGRGVPWWNRREVSWRCRRCCERKGVYNRGRNGCGSRFINRGGFDGRCRLFADSERVGNDAQKVNLCPDKGSDDQEGKKKDAEAPSE